MTAGRLDDDDWFVSCPAVRRGRADAVLLTDWMTTGDVAWVKRWGFESPASAMNAVDAALARIVPPDAADRAHREIAAAKALAESGRRYEPGRSERHELGDLGKLLSAVRLQVPLFAITRAPMDRPVSAAPSPTGAVWTQMLQDRHDGLAFRVIARRHGAGDPTGVARQVTDEFARFMERSAGPARERRTELLSLEIANLMPATTMTGVAFEAVRRLLARRCDVQGLRHAARRAAHRPGAETTENTAQTSL